MNDGKVFKVDDDIVEIPTKNVSVFLKDYPNAKEMNTYVVEKDTVYIPVENKDAFESDYPQAELLTQTVDSGQKKKDFPHLETQTYLLVGITILTALLVLQVRKLLKFLLKKK